MNQGGAAASFCQDYNTPCTFGMDGHFASLKACEAAWNDATTDCQGCWVTHLANAMMDSGSIHCSHACGIQGSPGACADCGNSCQ
jgi:hypothetical protein